MHHRQEKPAEPGLDCPSATAWSNCMAAELASTAQWAKAAHSISPFQCIQPSRLIPEIGDGKVILCIDDDVQVISLYDRYLTPQGYHVVALTDPTKAREVAKEVKPFAITLDIMMPGYDGWQVINDLKTRQSHA